MPMSLQPSWQKPPARPAASGRPGEALRLRPEPEAARETGYAPPVKVDCGLAGLLRAPL
jgi:hypothetical protein